MYVIKMQYNRYLQITTKVFIFIILVCSHIIGAMLDRVTLPNFILLFKSLFTSNFKYQLIRIYFKLNFVYLSL